MILTINCVISLNCTNRVALVMRKDYEDRKGYVVKNKYVK